MFAYKPKRLSHSLPRITSDSRSRDVIFRQPFRVLSLDQAKQTHARILLLGGHGKELAHLLAAIALCYPTTPLHLRYSISVYRTLRHPCIFAINNLIRCFARSISPRESIALYSSVIRESKKPNNHTFTFLLQACSNAVAAEEGAQVHAHVARLGFGGDVFVRNALISFYSVCFGVGLARRVFDENAHVRDSVTWNSMLVCLVRDNQISDAEKLFDEMPERDVISWSTMVKGYVDTGRLEEAFGRFREAKKNGIRPNEAMLVCVLAASAQLGLLEQGSEIHALVRSLRLPISSLLGTALIDMYAKCGCIERSKVLFLSLSEKDVWTWNVMICGLAAHGLGKEALGLFKLFVNEGFKPVSVTFVGVLSACCKAGLVSEGRRYFKLMTERFGIEPEMEHYGCMVDLYGRAGLVNKAVDLVENMEVKPDPVLWATLLTACNIHGHVELGEKIGNKLVELEPNHGGHYVQLSTIYAKARKWDEVVRVRRLMLERTTIKTVGWSLIEAQGKLHKFVAGDRDHERFSDIRKMLEVIKRRVSEAGYSPNISPVFHDIGEEEKESAINEHSEKLAIAFGLLVTEVGDCIRVVKNLRICEDCHIVCKIVSKVFVREIVVRDGSRFHHFKEGKCSCNDFW